MSKTMTPSEIAEELERATIFNPNSLLSEAAATIRALEGKCSEEALRHAATIRLASDIEAKLKIATEALDKIAHKAGIGNVTCARQAIARIKEV